MKIISKISAYFNTIPRLTTIIKCIPATMLKSNRIKSLLIKHILTFDSSLITVKKCFWTVLHASFWVDSFQSLDMC